jgi:hypothetical protein
VEKGLAEKLAAATQETANRCAYFGLKAFKGRR